ncbi:hypothetical protein [Cytobacillus sp. FSL R5-0596]
MKKIVKIVMLSFLLSGGLSLWEGSTSLTTEYTNVSMVSEDTTSLPYEH